MISMSIQLAWLMKDERKESIKEIENKMYACETCDQNSTFQMFLDSPCERLELKNLNKKPIRDKFMSHGFCSNFADGLANHSFFKSFMWLRVQERVIKDEIMKKEGDDLIEILNSKKYVDYELYIKFILNEYQELFDQKFDDELDILNDKITRDIEDANLFGLIFCTIIVLVSSFYYHVKSTKILEESIYFVRLIPFQTLSENTYVESKLSRVLGFGN